MNASANAAAAVLLALGASAACSGATASRAAVSACPADSGRVLRPQGPGWYHGPVVQVDSAGAEAGAGRGRGRRLLVQVQPPGAWSGRIWFGVNESTVLLCRSGVLLSRSAPLAPGVTVSAKALMIQESDPAQASADTLIVGPVP